MISMLIKKIQHLSLKNKFTDVYVNNTFGGSQSRSGEGSGPVQATEICRRIPELLKQLRAESMVDAPCGDLFWISKTSLPVQRYLGVDIVSDLIRINGERYGNEQRSFAVANLVADELPKADVILCRDCLVHLSYKDSLKILRNFKRSGSSYLLTTTFTDRTANIDLGATFWRPINLELPPFNFPKPLEIINEHCTECQGQYTDKSLALWLLNGLSVV